MFVHPPSLIENLMRARMHLGSIRRTTKPSYGYTYAYMDFNTLGGVSFDNLSPSHRRFASTSMDSSGVSDPSSLTNRAKMIFLTSLGNAIELSLSIEKTIKGAKMDKVDPGFSFFLLYFLSSDLLLRSYS